MRISTNSIMRNYRGGLNKSINRLNSAREKTLTERKFLRASEDPASATKAFQLRREYLRNEDHIHNVSIARGELDAVDSSLMQLNEMGQQIRVGILEGINGTSTTQSRTAIAQNMEELAASMVMNLNTKFGDKFLFGGASTKEPPFELRDVSGEKKLFYRGLDVNDPANTAELEKLSKESNYMDLGFGLKKDAGGELIKGTAYETSRPGIGVVGFGNDADGISKNTITLTLQIAKELRQDSVENDKVNKMLIQFDNNASDTMDKITQYGTNSKFLENTETRLIDSRINLNKKILDTENVDLAQAITEFSWAEYAYNAALKVGNSILSQSFIDFMR